MNSQRTFALGAVADTLKTSKWEMRKPSPRGLLAIRLKNATQNLHPSEGVALRKFSWEDE